MYMLSPEVIVQLYYLTVVVNNCNTAILIEYTVAASSSRQLHVEGNLEVASCINHNVRF